MSVYLQVKKDTKYLTRKINQLIACTNAEIERGRGGKRFFPPTKEIGTREGDRSGKGKYFPQILSKIALLRIKSY